MSSTDVTTKPKNSSSFESLVTDQEICRELDRLDWCAIHGAFYCDGKTEKIREIDVIARCAWEHGKKNRIFAGNRAMIRSPLLSPPCLVAGSSTSCVTPRD